MVKLNQRSSINKILILFVVATTLLLSCGGSPEKERATTLLKEKIGDFLPFKDVKVAIIENGLGVIVDKYFYFNSFKISLAESTRLNIISFFFFLVHRPAMLAPAKCMM